MNKHVEVYRYYEVKILEMLIIPIYYDIKLIGLKDQSLEEFIQTGEMIENETIKKLFKSHLFEITDQEAISFATILNIMRVTKSVNELPFHPEKSAIYEALKILRTNLPEAISYTRNRLNNYNPYRHKEDISMEKNFLTDLVNLSKIVNTININSSTKNDSITKTWHIDMVKILLTILDFTNCRGIKPSIKWTNAPAIEIIKKSLEIAKVISVDNHAIIKALKRYPDIHYLQSLVQ